MAKPEETCPRVEGEGCASLTGAAACDSGDSEPASGDSGAAGSRVPPREYRVEGGGGVGDGLGCGCQETLQHDPTRHDPDNTAPAACDQPDAGPGLLSLLVVLTLLVRVRRRRVSAWLGVLLVGLLPVVSPAPAIAGVDSLGPHPRDGGEFPALIEPDLGDAWHFQLGLAAQLLTEPVVLVGPGSAQPLVPWAAPLEVGGSLRLGQAVSFGAAATTTRTPSEGSLSGDKAVWATVPLREGLGPERGGRAVRPGPIALQLRLELPGKDSDAWVADPVPEGDVDLAVGRQMGPWSLVGNAGLRLAPKVSVPGQTWGTRWNLGFGARRPMVRGTSAIGELYGSFPVTFDLYVPGAVPVEVALGVSNRFAGGLVLTTTVGGGLSHGLGSPSLRWVTMASYAPRPATDLDNDTVIDRRDSCVEVAEDPDGVVDQDGCPEVDADMDGHLDADDRCAVEPETVNNWLDDDGCPDQVYTLLVSVSGPFQTAELWIGDAPPRTVLVDEVVAVPSGPGPINIRASAEGCRSAAKELDIQEDQRLVVVLDALELGTLGLRIVSAGPTVGAGKDPSQGVPLSGWVRTAHRDDLTPSALRPVPVGGADLSLPAGESTIDVRVSGFVPRRVPVSVPPGGRTDAVVVLTPDPSRRSMMEVLNTPNLYFGVDRAEPEPGSEDDLAAVAVLMLAHPEILLLRVEGHADELGGSAYNLELSQKRAGFVVDELVRLGVARSRLQAVGSGEAVPTSDARRVHFLVLVWDDTYATPGLPPLTPPSPGKTPPATRGKLSPNLPVAPPAPR